MRRTWLAEFICFLAALCCVAGFVVHRQQVGGQESPAAQPAAPVYPPQTKPSKKPLIPWRESVEAPIGERATVGGPIGPGGVEVMCDLPASSGLRAKNVGGRDGAGLCVFTSAMHAARFQGERLMWELQKQMRQEPGGGWPAKFDAMAAKYAPGAQYQQYEGTDPTILETALRSGRMPCVTYGYSERYGGRIAHMVNLVHLDSKVAAVLDNNFVGENEIEWMTRAEFLRRWTLTGGKPSGWAIVLFAPAPPPLPWN